MIIIQVEFFIHRILFYVIFSHRFIAFFQVRILFLMPEIKSKNTLYAAKYGGSSPKAVPNPQKKLYNWTASKIPKNEILYETVSE